MTQTQNQFKTMSSYNPEIVMKVLALPPKGLAEYLEFADIYNKITANLVAVMKILKNLREMNPDNSDHYEEEMDKRHFEANLTMMEWQVKRREILNKWLL